MAPSECPRCGYSPSQMENDCIASRQEGVLTIQAELRCLETSIARLTEARSALLRKLNGVRPAMRNLPPEILSAIFQFARPPTDFDERHPDFHSRNTACRAQERFLRALATVSHGWRQVAFATPRLWTNVILKIDVSSGPFSVDSSMALLGSYVEHSRNIPVSVELVFEDLRDDFEDDNFEDESEMDRLYRPVRAFEHRMEAMEPVQTAVFIDYASRIQDLLLIRPPEELVLYVNQTLPHCRSVTVFQPQPPILQDFYPLDLRHFPCLQRVQLIDWAVPLKVLLPSSVTTIRLRKIPVEDGIALLLSCRNVVHFELVDYLHWTWEDPGLTEPVVFPCLEHFRWSSGSRWAERQPGAEALDFLCHIRLPSLRSLVWSDEGGDDINDPTIQNLRRLFFSHLPQSLSSLTFDRMITHSENHIIAPLLNSVPQVTELHLTSCSEMTVRAAVDAVGRPSPILESNISPSVVLPNLLKMSVNPQGQPKWLSLRNFVPMLEALHKIGERRKRFELIVKEHAIWKEGEGGLRRFWALVEDGFDLKVVVGQRVLDLDSPSYL